MSNLPAHLRQGRNRGSLRTRSFRSFKHDSAEPHLGIQLTIRGGPPDIFTAFRDSLLADLTLVSSYNQPKRRCAGLSMTAYRRWKIRFIERIIAAAAR